MSEGCPRLPAMHHQEGDERSVATTSQDMSRLLPKPEQIDQSQRSEGVDYSTTYPAEPYCIVGEYESTGLFWTE